MPKKKKDFGPLYPASVFTRIRPQSDGTADGHGDGEAVEMKLDGWEESCMLIEGRGGAVQRFEFPKVVLGPEVQQGQVFDTVTPEMLEGFLAGESNSLLFAYGQTGTGKTHTMFGPADSLASPTPHEDWGLLPRIVSATIEAMKGKTAKLFMSAMEFYCWAAWDLNADKRNLVTVNNDGEVYGHTFTEIAGPGDIASFIERVYGNRKVSKTKMNSGSSRSHVCIMLTLYQVDNESGDCCETTFSIIDLAGSERPGKTGAERMAVLDATLEAQKCLTNGKDLSVAAQGSLINMELTLITTAIKQATDQWKAGRRFKPQTDWPPSMKYMLGCCTGRGRLGVVVGISQSPQNGWETWFSCTWGENVAKLQAPCEKQKPKNINKQVKTAIEDAKAAQKSLDTAGKSASFAKYAAARQGLVDFTKQRLAHLQELQAMYAEATSGGSSGESEDTEAEQTSKVLLEIMSCDMRTAFDVFDKNGDGVLDKPELVAILSRGNGLHKFSEEVAGKVTDDILKVWGSDGKLTVEQIIEWLKMERAWVAMSQEEKDAFWEDPENADYAWVRKEIQGQRAQSEPMAEVCNT